jgi:hypothetical protein
MPEEQPINLPINQVDAVMPQGFDYNRESVPEQAQRLEYVHSLRPFKKKQVKDANTGEYREVVTGGDVDQLALTDFWGFTNHINSLSYSTRNEIPYKRLCFKIGALSWRMKEPRNRFTPEVNAKLDQIENLVDSINEMSVDGFGYTKGISTRQEQTSQNEFKQVQTPSKSSVLLNNIRRI